jgi:hypothetical protein
VDPRARLTLSISVSPLAKALAAIILVALIGAAIAGLVLLEGNMRLVLLPLLPMIGYAAMGLGRQSWWLDGTVLYRQKGLRTKRIDLSHANVEVGYVASGERLSTMKVRDPVHGKRMTVPLLTLAGRPLPREQIMCLHDAIVAGQRWRRGKAADRAATVSSYLQTLS